MHLKLKQEFVIIPIFIFIYIFSLTFLYVEGDDAYSIMYHALGRNEAIQGPYALYQKMMDVVLRWLPADETIVRISAIAIHAFVGILFPFLIIRLLKGYIVVTNRQVFWLAIFTPFILPEFIFFGLYYQCSTIALSCILGAHILLKRAFDDQGHYYKKAAYWLAILLFGFGVGFRWECGFYLIAILIDLFAMGKHRGQWAEALKSITITGALCSLCVIIFLYAIGIRFNHIFSQASNVVPISERELSWKINIGSSLSLFTPFIVLFFALGVYRLVQKKQYLLLILFVVTYVPVIKTMPTEILNPRRIINCIPFLFIISCVGAQFFISFFSTRTGAIFVTTIILLPWIVGIQINSNDTMWGPGFDIKQQVPVFYNGSMDPDAVDSRVSIDAVQPVFFKDGFAVPFEGPRPVWGYGSVIFGGKWRAILQKFETERQHFLNIAIQQNLPIIQEDYGVNLMIMLVRDGYSTNHGKKGVAIANDVHIRKFFKNTDTVTFIFPPGNYQNNIMDTSYLQRCAAMVKANKIALYSYSSSMLMQLKCLHPNNVSTLGPTTAIISF